MSESPTIERAQRRGPGSRYRLRQSLRFLATRDRAAVAGFLLHGVAGSGVGPRHRVALLWDCLRVTYALRGYHTLAEAVAVGSAVLARSARSGLTVVECGVGKGSSTCKLSLFVRAAGGRLIACDSFRGIPANDERHVHLDGRPVVFRAGAFHGRLAEVRRNLESYGAPEVVELRKGWFEESLPGVSGPLDVVLLDVDLVASTRVCVAALYPLLRHDGVLFTQDGHLRAVVELLGDPRFWTGTVGVEPPPIAGLGRDKLLAIPGPGAVSRATAAARGDDSA